MGNNIMFTFNFPNSINTSCYFPLHLRIPTWCQEAEIKINGKTIQLSNSQSGIEVIKREWHAGDQLELILPMKVFTSEWYENSVAVERGPLVYSLKIGEKWVKKQIKDDHERFGKSYNEVLPTTPWNYGLIDFDTLNFSKNFIVVEYPEKMKAKYFWNQESAPIEIKVKAKKIPSWTLYNEMAGPQPYSRMIYGINNEKGSEEEITLIPYGCTTLRITEFPVLGKFD